MRPPIPLLCLLALAGCQPLYAATGTLAGVSVLTLATLGRTAPDAIVSLIRDRDCSAVRLEQGLSYCIPVDPPPVTPEFCTHTLGIADCWAHPELLPNHPAALADAPVATPQQIAHRAHRWPDEWSLATGFATHP